MNQLSVRGHLPFAILILIALLVGLFTANRYGQTWDDQGLWEYRQATLANYQALFAGERAEYLGPDNLRFYGPAFLLFSQAITAMATALSSSVPNLPIWHISILTSFLVGLVSFYSLCLRLVSRESAFWASFLFASQPLLWGHALINGKDIPFMAFFLVAVALGLRAVDGVPDQNKQAVSVEWDRPALRRFASWLLATTAIWLLLLALTPAIKNEVDHLLNSALASPTDSWLARIFARIAPNLRSRPIEGYAMKALLYIRYVVAVALVLVLLREWFRILQATPSLKVWLRDGLSAINHQHLGAGLRSSRLWVAGLALGAAMAVRVLGLFAGGLILCYALIKKRNYSVPFALLYLLIAALTTYSLWPALWAAPFSHFWNSLSLMSQFPWNGPVMFNGTVYDAVDLPPGFLPTLLVIQLSLPALILIVVGLWRTVRSFRTWLLTLCAAWFLIPLVYTLVFDSTLYDNFRQYLFILPPLFVFAGLGIESLFARVQRVLIPRLILAAVVLSALITIARLQPYEYVHYNVLIGGLAGAAGRFELDYWATALTEAAQDVNQIAPPNARLVVWGPEHVVQTSARPDLLVEGLNGGTYDIFSGYDYALISFRAGNGTNFYQDIEPQSRVERLGVDLALVKALDCTCSSAGDAP